MLLCAVFAKFLRLIPFTFDGPRAKALVTGVISRKMAMLRDSVLEVLAEKGDFVVRAHVVVLIDNRSLEQGTRAIPLISCYKAMS